MNRFSRNEISANRIKDAVVRRVKDLPHSVAWMGYSSLAKINRSRLNCFKDKHIDERCFIMGNGPSLANMDLTLLKDEITFGLNRIYLLFDTIPFLPTYYVSVNELVLEQFALDIKTLSMPKFINWNSRNHFGKVDSTTNFIRLKFSLRDEFNSEMDGRFYSGGTVTYVAIQLAYIMGFSEVILIGVDHSFVDKGIPNKTELRNDTDDANHFHPDYFPKGSKWQLPDLHRSELAYKIARKAYENDGRKILDATINGQCHVFDKVDFYSLF